MAKQLPRGIRNNNPGNIEKGAPWQGLAADQSTDRRFCVFTEPRWGIRAIARVLITYQDKRLARDGSRIDTVQEIIARWAPAGENNVSSYVRAVRRAMGIEPGAEVDVHCYEHMRPLIAAIIRHENGRNPGRPDGAWYDDETLDAGLRLAGIEPPLRPLAKSRTMAGTVATAAGAAGAGGLEAVDRLGDLGERLTGTAESLRPLADLGWVFQALFAALLIGGIGFTVLSILRQRREVGV